MRRSRPPVGSPNKSAGTKLVPSYTRPHTCKRHRVAPTMSMDSAHESVSSQGQRSIAVARPAHPALVRQVEAFCGATDRAQLAARFVGLVRWIEMHDSGRSFTQREALLDYLETHPEVRSCAQQRLGELLN